MWYMATTDDLQREGEGEGEGEGVLLLIQSQQLLRLHTQKKAFV